MPEEDIDKTPLTAATTALRTILDPEIGLNVVDLGLVRKMLWNAGTLELYYQLTSASCPVGEMIANGMRTVLEEIPGVLEVRLELIEDPPWGPHLITPEGRKVLRMD
ncbi:MAG: metal-sulfur cluster assembly factor [bacterium]